MNTIVDSGPLVAALDKRDKHHEFAIHHMEQLKAPFYTCEAVLSETFFLLQRAHVSQKEFSEILRRGKITVSFSYEDHDSRVLEIIQTYANLPASFADACLVQMAETMAEAKIFTLDTDFTIYRDTTGQPLSLISPG